MRAGAYIRGQHDSEIYAARLLEDEAGKLEIRARDLRMAADAHRAAAARWASGTELEEASDGN